MEAKVCGNCKGASSVPALQACFESGATFPGPPLTDSLQPRLSPSRLSASTHLALERGYAILKKSFLWIGCCCKSKKKQERRRLEDWLLGRYHVVLPDHEHPLEGDFDLAILDGGSLRQFPAAVG